MEQMKAQAETAKTTGEAYTKAMDFQTGEAQKYSERYWGTQVPLEDKLIDKALSFNEKSEQEKMAMQAGADVEQARAQGMEGVSSELRARGTNLGSGAAVSAMMEMNTQATLAKVGAISKTRDTARQMGWQRLGEATALGKGLPSFGQGSTQLALGAAGGANAAAAGAVNGAIGVGNSSANQLNAQGNIYGSIGSIGNNTYATSMNGAKIGAENDPSKDIYGALLGAGMSYFSDVRLKKNIVRTGTTARGNAKYSWEWISGGYAEGVLAHEVQHIPGAVSVGPGGFLMVDYSLV
jgi:hypothetical protein